MRRILGPLAAASITLLVALMLNRHHTSGRWLNPLIWTVIVFGSVLELRRRHFKTPGFWTLFVLGVVTHCVVMWLSLSVLVPSVTVPTLVALVLAIAETYAFTAFLRPSNIRKVECFLRD
jgi:hypothetical protein